MDCKAGPEMARETRETRAERDSEAGDPPGPTLAVPLSLIPVSLPAFVTKYLDKIHHKMSHKQK